ncbi:MAG TPA: DinB family protein [Vicinamibacterales bacterium]|nr:DinB family protein [Vicinamibacterales bacterium]
MKTPLGESLGNLEEARTVLRAAVDAVPEGRRGERPAPDRWSVSEILEHLSLVERRFAAIIAIRIGEAREAGLGPEQRVREPLPPNLQQMLNDRANRRNAPEAVRPTGKVDHAAAWTDLERIRKDLRATVEAAEGLALSGVTHNHPVFGTLNVYQLMDFIAGHEMRHARQIKGIAEVVS